MIFNAILLVTVIILTIVAGSAIDFSRLSHPERRTSITAAQSAIPDTEFKTLNGETAHLYNYKGRVVILNFWASWCTPCVAEFPLLLSLARSMPDRLTLIAMSLDENSEDLDLFLKKHGGDYKSLPNVVIALDPDRSISQGIFSTFRLPETVIIAPDSTFHRKIVGYTDDWTKDEMRQEILSLYAAP